MNRELLARFLFSKGVAFSMAKVRSWDEKAALISVAALLVIPVWLRAGTNPDWSWPMTWVALLVTGFLVILSWKRCVIGPAGFAVPAPFIRWRDPIAALGFLFLLLLLAQWWNAGRLLFYDPATAAWSYSEPRHPGWPSAITRAEARQMLDWFFPALILVLALRSPGFTGRMIRKLWRVVAYHAGIVALFGLANYAWGATHMLGLLPMQLHFFATFGYPNHAGSYFLMTMCLSAALLSWELAGDRDGLKRGRVMALAAVLVLSYMGAVFSLSRLAILLATAILPLLVFFLIASVWSKLQAVQRMHLIAVSLAVMGLAMVLTMGLGREAIRREFKPEADNKTFLDRETSFRWFQITSAFHIWQDHPWVGVGGWGYRYLMGHYLPKEQWRRITDGKANVHNDPIQFLAEFGLVGAACLTGVVGLLLVAGWRNRHLHTPLWWMPLLGCALVGGQSMIDLPFRSSAVMALWLLLLAGAVRVVPPRRSSCVSSAPARQELS